jgi:hypothetical protein
LPLAAPAQTLAERERYLLSDLSTLNGRWDQTRPSGPQVVADADRLSAAYSDMARYQQGYGLQPQIAPQAYSWLARAGSFYGADPTVGPALMRAYGQMGDFYNRNRQVYAPGAVLAFSGANRIARGLVLSPRTGGGFEGDLTRYGLAWAAASYFYGAAPPPPGPETEGLPYYGVPPAEAAPLSLPMIDENALDAAEKPFLQEVRARFRITASHVSMSSQALEELASRLHQQNLRLNNQDAAAALMMRGFLEDAADLIRAGRLQQALEALTRADYQRGRLKNVTGQ